MITIYITLVACLAGAPRHCQEFNVGDIPTQSVIAGMMQCGIQGQAYAAPWAEEHPNWEVQKISCYTEKPEVGDDL